MTCEIRETLQAPILSPTRNGTVARHGRAMERKVGKLGGDEEEWSCRLAALYATARFTK